MPVIAAAASSATREAEWDQRLLDLGEELAGHLPCTMPTSGRPRVSIVKCRYYRGQWRRHGKQRLVYAWGRKPPSFDWVKETYRQRFAIGQTYRQLHQA